ncbi:MarR family transcriptional regulator [Pseudonocardia sp. RS11V-5]|uniref:MarR family winged helix-turn-helix transcriptional regulator n=1 Tax=Pseudonocardia terrae TaxID=2905831 RepID=UPI001E2A6BB8|nr:MarR family transcriptional regulator [Pseudonocardia terrae]MCE3552581.1 MarR family transcriptional regulator [Pseudonocardia terrae]
MASPSDAGGDYAAELEVAARGLLEVSVAALGRLDETVGPGQLRALQALARLGRVNVSALAADLELLPSTASRLSDRLTAAGLISRQVSPTNRRATLLELTPAGRRMLDEFAGVRARALAEVAGRMTEQDRAALLRGARAFTVALGEQAGGAAP